MSVSLIGSHEFAKLFADFRRTAWRWEAQTIYREPYEAEPWQRWRDGLPDDLAWLEDWLIDIRAATAEGRSFQRVRVFTEPPTEYLRWQRTVTPANIDAGEDIRVLTQADARALKLPDYDFWLFDDEVVARMYFGDAGWIGAEMISEPGTVAKHLAWRDVAWRYAVPYAEYMRTR
jgi:hypothetical protein